MIRIISAVMALLILGASSAFSATQSVMPLMEELAPAGAPVALSETHEPAPAPSPTFTPGPEPEPTPRPECTKLMSRMIELNSNLSSLKASVVATSQDVGSVMNSWYGTLSSYYGRQVYISYGAFSAIRESAQTSYENASYFSRQFSALEIELRYVTQDLAACLMN